MADFQAFLPILLKHEGGFVNDPVDPGGVTNKGITINTFQACAMRLLGVAPTLDALKTLTDQQAGTIYKELYWNRICGDQISLQDLANIVCDFQVNAGSRSSKLLQQVLNELGAVPPLAIDGILGTSSLAALQLIDQRDAYALFKSHAIDFYRNLATQRPELQKFLRGWLNRISSFPDLVS